MLKRKIDPQKQFAKNLQKKKLKKTALKPIGKRAKANRKGDREMTLFARSAEQCGWCGLPGELEPHHIVSRRHTATRHLEENILPVHRHCHTYIETHRAEFDLWMQQHHGERYERLQRIKTGREAA